MTAEPVVWPDVICGHRENDGFGLKECVQAPGHEGGHYLIRLVQRPSKDIAS